MRSSWRRLLSRVAAGPAGLPSPGALTPGGPGADPRSRTHGTQQVVDGLAELRAVPARTFLQLGHQPGLAARPRPRPGRPRVGRDGLRRRLQLPVDGPGLAPEAPLERE